MTRKEEYAFEAGPALVSTTTQTAQASAGRVDVVEATLGVHAYYKTALSGANNDLVWIARVPGTSSLTVTYTDPSTTNAALAVTYDDPDITVSLATDDEGTITTKASEIAAYVNNDEAASEIEQAAQVSLAAGNTGAGVVTALSQQPVAGPAGSSPTLDVKLQTSMDAGATWLDVGNFAQKTDVGSEEKVFTGLGEFTRWNLALSGTSAEFAYSLTVYGKEVT